MLSGWQLAPAFSQTFTSIWISTVQCALSLSRSAESQVRTEGLIQSSNNSMNITTFNYVCENSRPSWNEKCSKQDYSLRPTPQLKKQVLKARLGGVHLERQPLGCGSRRWKSLRPPPQDSKFKASLDLWSYLKNTIKVNTNSLPAKKKEHKQFGKK